MTTNRTQTALALAAAAAMLPATAAAAAPFPPLQTVATFDIAQLQTPESIAIDRHGTIYVSLSFAARILRIAPGGRQTALAIPAGGGITAGVAIDHRRDGDVDVAVRSPDPAAAGIWRVPRVAFARPRRIAALPTRSFANGITFDAHGDLYIADSNLGRVWRLAPGARHATVWATATQLAPTGARFEDFPPPGANGIKVAGSAVYVSNTATRRILAIPIRPDGSAGAIGVYRRNIEADDFASRQTATSTMPRTRPVAWPSSHRKGS